MYFYGNFLNHFFLDCVNCNFFSIFLILFRNFYFASCQTRPFKISQTILLNRSVCPSASFEVSRRHAKGHGQYSRAHRSAPKGTLLEGRRLVIDTYLAIKGEGESKGGVFW